MRILLATPTRGRPENFRQMVHSARRTANQPELLSITARIDLDDPHRTDYTGLRGCNIIQGERVRLPQAWNQIVERRHFDIVMMCADDLLFRTTGWDDDVRSVFEIWPDRIGMVYADDGIHGQRLATHSFISKEWVDAVGYYLPDSLHGDFVDNFLHTLANGVGRVAYLPRVYIEHLHPLVHKAAMDDTYDYRLTGEGPAQAQAAWKKLLDSPEIPAAIERLKGAMSE